MTRMRSTSYICVCVVFPNSETCVQWINPHQLQHKEKWQDSRMTFTTPASASLRTSRPLSTPTSDQLRTADKQRKRRRMVLSTLLSDLTVPVVRQGEQLLSHKNPQRYTIFENTHIGWWTVVEDALFLSSTEQDVKKLGINYLNYIAQSTKHMWTQHEFAVCYLYMEVLEGILFKDVAALSSEIHLLGQTVQDRHDKKSKDINQSSLCSECTDLFCCLL